MRINFRLEFPTAWPEIGTAAASILVKHEQVDRGKIINGPAYGAWGADQFHIVVGFFKNFRTLDEGASEARQIGDEICDEVNRSRNVGEKLTQPAIWIGPT